MPSILKLRGLSTFSNELEVPEGSLKRACNVVIDRDDVAQPRRGLNCYGTSLPCSLDRTNQVFVYKNRILRHFDTSLQYDSDGSGTFSTFSGCFGEITSGLRIKGIEDKGNFLFTTDSGIKKISATSNTEFTTASCYIIDAGGPKGLDVDATLTYVCSGGGFMTPFSKAAYRIVWGYTDVNCKLILGAPSQRFVVLNPDDAETADVNLTTTIPCDVTTTSYFYQTYRSPLVCSAGCPCPSGSFPCLVPEEEYNLVCEQFVTAAQITAGTVTINDITCESFRESGALLYTNATSGQGILQANEKPPIAKDIAVFKGSAFYADTSDRQRKTITMIGSCCTKFTSGSTKIIIGNSSREKQYTYTGATEVQVITAVANSADSLDNKYFLICTASNERGYTVLFNSAGCAVFPVNSETCGRIPVTITVGACDANTVVASALNTAINLACCNQFNCDLTSTVCGAVVTVTWLKNGNVNDTVDSTCCGTGFTIPAPSTQGDGNETNTSDGADVLLSSLITPGQSIDETARALVKMINRDIGTKEITTFSAVAKACLVAGESFLFNGALDNCMFQFYYDFAAAVCVPTCCNSEYTNIKIDITCDTTATDVATKTACIIGSAGTPCVFCTTSCTALVTVTSACIGQVTDAADVDTGYTFTVATQGSCAGIVYAYYLSGACDLPGEILLETRNLNDPAFYIGVEDAPCKSTECQYNPRLDQSSAITCISVAAAAVVTSAGHGLTSCDTVFLYDTNSTPNIDGPRVVTVIDPCTYSVPVTTTVTGCAGNWFTGNVLSSNCSTENRLFFSKSCQAEAVPLLNFVNVGAQDKPIRRILPLRDNLFILKEDGVFILTGSSPSDFRVQLLDNSTPIIAPDSAVVLNNQIFMLSTQGVVKVSDTGVEVASRDIEDKILDVTTSRYSFEFNSFGVAYESDRAYYIWLPTCTSDTVATQAYRLNTFNNTWTRHPFQATAGIINCANDKMYIGAGCRNELLQERKNKDRTDYSDRTFDLCINTNGYNTACKILSISSVANTSIGDAITQDQFVTIAKFNRTLKKLDVDSGLTDNDYFSGLPCFNCGVSPGDNIGSALQNLNTKIIADDAGASCLYTPTPCLDITTFSTITTEFNNMTSILNGGSSDSSINDYVTICTTTPNVFETLVSSICNKVNDIGLIFNMDFLEGPIVLHKGIEAVIEWNPQDFGDPSILKHIPEGTILFDGNNFFDAEIAYASDLSKGFESRTFSGKGIGWWGGFDWGETVFGGDGSDVPHRALVPRQKQKCRYLTPRFTHRNAREDFTILGISMVIRSLSNKGYR